MEKIKTSFDKAELEFLKEGLKRTHTERIKMGTRFFLNDRNNVLIDRDATINPSFHRITFIIKK